MTKKLQNKKGFTLAELLIVVAIIAILMAIMIPAFGTSRGRAVMAKDAANLRSILSEAITDSMADVDNYSPSTGVLIVNLDAYLTGDNATKVKFDKGTKATYTQRNTESKTPACITVTYAGLDPDDNEVITLDYDVMLGTFTGGAPSQRSSGTINLPTPTTT